MASVTLSHGSPGPSRVGSTDAPSAFESITESKWCRLTIGRISCLVKAPIYLVGALFLAVKACARGLCAAVFLGYAKDIFPSISLQGVYIDLRFVVNDIWRTLMSLWAVIASPKPLEKIGESVIGESKIVKNYKGSTSPWTAIKFICKQLFGTMQVHSKTTFGTKAEKNVARKETNCAWRSISSSLGASQLY
jgi:hypothetical protein